MENKEFETDWKRTTADIFWGEIAPCDHVLQVYDSDSVFLDALTGFVGNGINSNDSCIVIATDPHLMALDARLNNCGLNISHLKAENRYIPIKAEDILSEFMVNGWPEEDLFNRSISSLLLRGRGNTNRKIRAFGEMVAILWAGGNNGATVHLEYLWDKFCKQEAFSLFCAYPKIGFTENITDSIVHICNAHSKMINGTKKQLTEIFYKDTDHKELV